jgi:hypothetical protein
VSIRGYGNHGCGVSEGLVYFVYLQTLLNHKTGDGNSKGFIKMARVGNMLLCQPLLCLIARAPKNKGVRSKQ